MKDQSMEPGPELDALIAEKVMGWKKESYRWMCDSVYVHTVHNEDHGTYYEECMPWRPSELISHAWEVVEKFKGGFDVCKNPLSKLWDVYVLPEGESRIALTNMPTAPHAICLAALKAVGVNNG